MQSIFNIFEIILANTNGKKSKNPSLTDAMLSLEVLLLFLSQIFYGRQNFVFLISFYRIDTAKLFFLL